MSRCIAWVSVSLCALSCSGNDFTGPPPTPQVTPSSITVSPQSTALGVNQTVRFAATITFSDGSTSQMPVTWTATGGTVDAAGEYLGGSVTGDYHVIARAGNGVADTAVVLLGVPISPGQGIQAAVDASPPGTTFILNAGLHSQQTIIPKSDDRFIGEPGVVLDGQGVTGSAFSAGTAAPYPGNVIIRGLKVTGYEPSFQRGAVDAGGNTPTEGTLGWVIDSNEVAYNGEYGIRIGNSTRVTYNNVHHNKRLNIAGSGTNTLIASNEIAFGNYLNAFDADFEAGGTKFTFTDGLVLQNNYVHDNVGVGLHLDLNNINSVLEGNRIDHNGSDGIVIEISYKTTILNNTVTDNGWFDPRNRYGFLWNAGIGIHASPDVEVYGNTVSGNYAGVVAIEQNRQRDPASYGLHIVQNLNVHDNIITQTNLPRTATELSVAAGAATDIPGNSVLFAGRNNRFSRNTYYLGTNPRPFAWQSGIRSEAEWKAYGQDVDGVFYR